MSAARPRATVRRRAKKSVIARVRVMWVILVLVAVVFGAGGYALVQSPWFRVNDVLVDLPASSPVSDRDVRAAAAIPPDANVWLLRTPAIRARIEAIPYVATARVARAQFPHPTLTLRIATRTPVACLRAAGRLETIDATPRVLQNGCGATLPRIDVAPAALTSPGRAPRDAAISDLLAAGDVLRDHGVAVGRLGRDRWGGLEVTTVDGVVIRLGADERLLPKAAELIGPIRSEMRGRKLAAIDLRAPGAPVVRFR